MAGPIPKEKIVIKGWKGTEAERYAMSRKDDFTFIPFTVDYKKELVKEVFDKARKTQNGGVV